jgi:hypothetical protein
MPEKTMKPKDIIPAVKRNAQTLQRGWNITVFQFLIAP